MSARIASALLLVTLAGCAKVKFPDEEGLSSFSVKVDGVFLDLPGRPPLGVVSACATRYGGQDKVPADVRGSSDCPYIIPRGSVDVDLTVHSFNRQGDPIPFDGTVAFRSVPGDLAEAYEFRYVHMRGGELKASTRAAHLYGGVRFWVEDAPPEYLYADGGRVEFSVEDPTRERTYATGTSQIVHFEEPTLAKVQHPDDKACIGFDNRSSPFVGQFMVIGRNPESGSTTLQSCEDSGPDGGQQLVDGQPATLVVTGTDPSGFFVTDLTACRVRERLIDANGSTVRVAEPDGFLPGTYGSMFVYNYSYPDGLDEGDLIWTLSGAVQEFTSTTQLTFPAWSIREKVRERPPSEWKIYLDLVKPVELNGRICGLDNASTPFLTDSLCGHNRRNLKLESLESGLVKLTNVRFPEVFTTCDKDGNGEVPFFCEGTVRLSPEQVCTRSADCATRTCSNVDSTCTPVPGDACGRTTCSKRVCAEWKWQDCDFETDEPQPGANEMQCNIDCVTGQGEFAGKRCAERSTYEGFGQYVVEMAAPGPAEGGFDSSLPARISTVPLSATSQQALQEFTGGAEASIWCNGAAHYKTGDNAVVATPADPPIAPGQRLHVRLGANDSTIAIVAAGLPAAGTVCHVGWNPGTKINLITKDAVPELNPDCDENSSNLEAAAQCRNTRGASYDVVGHLRQLQPGRPRWAVIPRDAEDLCCRPGPGLSCPKPLKACP